MRPDEHSSIFGRIGVVPGRPRAGRTIGSKLVQPLVPFATTTVAAALMLARRAGKAESSAAVHVHPSEDVPEVLPPARARAGTCLVGRAALEDAAVPRRVASSVVREREAQFFAFALAYSPCLCVLPQGIFK